MNDSNERKSVTYPVNNHKTDDTEDIKLLLNDTHNISWSSIIEKNILEIGEKAKGYKIMHIKTSRQISYKYDLLMYSGIFLGPLSGLLSGIGSPSGANPFALWGKSTCPVGQYHLVLS